MAVISAFVSSLVYPLSAPLLAPCAKAVSRGGSFVTRTGRFRQCKLGRERWATALLSCGVSALGVRSVTGSMLRSPQGSAPTCSLEVEQFPCLSDNYGFLIHDSKTGTTAAVDTPDADAYLAALQRRGWQLTHILSTHHHSDHVGGNLALKRATGCKIVGPKGEQQRIPGIDVAVDEGDTVTIGSHVAKVLNVGGHTIGHIAYHFEDAGMAFVGDSLFSLGCGRLFEGTYEQMFATLQKLRALPPATAVYCAHEYTAANARFALSVEPGNRALQRRAAEIEALRARGAPTVPTTVAAEREANPFLRWDSPELAAAVAAPPADGLAVFTATRQRKDKF